MELLGFDFGRPWALLLLLLAPLPLWASLRALHRGPRFAFPPLPLLMRTGRGLFARVHWLPAALRSVALAAVVLALAQPLKSGAIARDLSVEGIDIVVALDLSTSMNAVDFQPDDRLAAAKQTLSDFIERRPDDRIGLVVFAGEAFTQCPLTLDHRVLRGILSELRTGAIADGTAVGDAIATSLNRLRDSEAASKVVILITDGDSNAGRFSPSQAASMASELGVAIHPIMVGRECRPGEDCRVPFPAGTDLLGRPTFQRVEIPVNPALLREIAQTTGGSFHVATDTEGLKTGLDRILSELEKSRIVEAKHIGDREEIYDRFLLPALLLGLIESALAATRFRRFP